MGGGQSGQRGREGYRAYSPVHPHLYPLFEDRKDITSVSGGEVAPTEQSGRPLRYLSPDDKTVSGETDPNGNKSNPPGGAGLIYMATVSG